MALTFLFTILQNLQIFLWIIAKGIKCYVDSYKVTVIYSRIIWIFDELLTVVSKALKRHLLFVIQSRLVLSSNNLKNIILEDYDEKY